MASLEDEGVGVEGEPAESATPTGNNRGSAARRRERRVESWESEAETERHLAFGARSETRAESLEGLGVRVPLLTALCMDHSHIYI